MKKLYTWVSEAQYKDLRHRVKRLKLTPYAYLKNLVLADLGEPREKAHLTRTQIVFGFLIYGLIASTLILLRFPIVIIPSALWLTTGEPWDYATGKYVPHNPLLVLLAGLAAVALFLVVWYGLPRVRGGIAF